MADVKTREAAVAQDGFADNDGVKLAVRDFGGTGPSVLLIHGAGRTLADWALIAPLLVPDFRVVAMDVRGHGLSDDGEWTWDAVVDDARAVISALSLGPVTIVGHSLGGMIAALYGERFGDLTAAVNLDGHGSGRPDQYVGIPLDEVVHRMTEMQELARQLQGAQPATLSAEQVAAGRAAMLARAAAMGLDGVGAESFDRTLAEQPDGQFRTRPLPATIEPLMASVEALDLFATYRRVACPLLVYNAAAAGPPQPGLPEWVGDLLAAYRVGLGRDLEALAADCTHVQVQTVDATHALIFEQPQLIAGQVSVFIRQSIAAA